MSYSSLYVERGVEYARSVLSGEILACLYVRLACQRFLDDLERDDLIFVEDPVHNFGILYEALQHFKGRTGNLSLLPWMAFVACNLFGLKRRETGLRKYKWSYLEVARKNAKSTFAAVVGVYMLTLDDEPGAEVYCAATTKEQAMEVFSIAHTMLEKDPDVAEQLGITMMKESIFVPTENAKFRPVTGDPPDGANPHCGIIDEYHEHSSNDAYKTLETGMGARKQALMFVITTAGKSIGGPCHKRRGEIIRILEKVTDDEVSDKTFGMVYTVEEHGDDSEEWTKREALILANPSLDESVMEDWLRDQQIAAQRETKDQPDFKTKHCNVWVGSDSPYLNMHYWRKCRVDDLTFDECVEANLCCVVATDLASKIDFCAAVTCFFEDDDKVGDENEVPMRYYYLFPEFWLPEERMRSVELYRGWEPFVNVTPGNVLDVRAVRDRLLEIDEKTTVLEFVFDNYMALGLEQEISDYTAGEIVDFRQDLAMFTPAMAEFESAVNGQRLMYAPNPVFDWMAENTTSRYHYDQKRRRPVKPDEDEGKKIDGIVAALMCVGRAMPQEDGLDDLSKWHGNKFKLPVMPA